MDGSGNGHLRTVCDYVHLNPVRARLLKSEEPIQTFAWSSYPDYLRPARQRPGWLRVERLLGEKGIPRDTEAGREQFAKEMERRRLEETADEYEQIRRSWFLGSEEFRKELLAMATEKVGLNHYGADRRETEEQKAERIICEEFNRLGWQQEELQLRSKGHKSKVALARKLRGETTMSLRWIAKRLHMGSWTYVSNLLREKPSEPQDTNQELLLLCQ